MTDRDTFAAAALTGFSISLSPGAKYDLELAAKQCYELADAMLRERGTADRDNCVAGNQPEIAYPRSSAVPDAWATAYAVTRACEIANHDAVPEARADLPDERPQNAVSANGGTPGAASRDGSGTGNTPVTEPMPKQKRAEVSDEKPPRAYAKHDEKRVGWHTTGEPVAWAVRAKDIGATAATCSTFMEAERLAARSADWRKEIVPLYTTPQPTLTDAEREAVEQAIDAANGMGQAEPWTMRTMRGLLERLK